MAHNRGRSYARSNDPNYAVGLREHSAEPNQHSAIPDPFLLMGYELEVNVNPQSHAGDCGVQDLGIYQALGYMPWPILSPPEDDSRSSSRASLNHQSAPSSITSLDGSYGTLPGDERSVVLCQEHFVGATHNAPLAMGIIGSWPPAVDSRLAGTSEDWEIPSTFAASGSDGTALKHDICEEENRGSTEGISQEVQSTTLQSESDRYRVEAHKILDAITPENNPEQTLPAVQPPNSNQYDCRNKIQSCDTLPRHRAGAKHTIPSEPQPEPKRGKRRNNTNCSLHETPSNPHKSTECAVTIATSECDASRLVQHETEEIQRIGGESSYCGQCLQPWPELASQSPFTDTAMSPSPAPQGCEEISNVRIIDILDLLRLDGGLQMAFKGLDLSNISFNCSEKIIKLRGPSPATKRAKGELENSLKEVRRLAPRGYHSSMLNHGGLMTKHSARFKSKLSASSHFSPAPTKIFAIGTSEEDSDALATWMKYIGPILGDVLTPTVGENYSASLVRQGESTESSTLTIRIQSVSGQSEEVRKKIRAQIHAVCERHGRAPIPLHFSQGSIVLLAGSRSEYETVEDGQANQQGCFPHHRRYWRHPGMGASIGPGSCKTVSATLGGYILMDRRKYMLTADHFIDYAIGTEATTEMSQMTITSPSLLDVEELTEDLSQSIRDNEAMIENLIKQDFPLGATLEQLLCRVGITTLGENHELLKGFLRDLSREAQDFSLGTVHGRCVPQLREATRPYKLPSPEHEKIPIRHRMDWSISTVNCTREGQNRHRHKFCAESETVDFLSERLYPHGAGNLSQLTCDVEPNVPVHYVGQSSGRQSGKISARLVFVTCNGKSSWEWAMVVPDDQQQEGDIYCGDSGAWIIRDSDNALVGLLWGWNNGQLIFTPINDVFADIVETFNTTEICLPKPSTGPGPGTALTRNATATQAQNICRVKRQGPRERRSWPIMIPHRPLTATSNGQPLRADRISINSLVNSSRVSPKKADPVILGADAAKDRPPSPVPSLTSSVSSSQQIISRSPSPIELRSQADYTLEKATVVISEENGSEGISKTDEEPQLYSQLLHIPEKRLGKSGGMENRLSLGFIFTMLTFPKSLHKEPKRGSGTAIPLGT